MRSRVGVAGVVLPINSRKLATRVYVCVHRRHTIEEDGEWKRIILFFGVHRTQRIPTCLISCEDLRKSARVIRRRFISSPTHIPQCTHLSSRTVTIPRMHRKLRVNESLEPAKVASTFRAPPTTLGHIQNLANSCLKSSHRGRITPHNTVAMQS